MGATDSPFPSTGSNVYPLQRQSEAQRADADLRRSGISPASWDGEPIPRIPWLIENIALTGAVTLISGEGGRGKSQLMQQLCSAVALGREWVGKPTTRGRAIYFACEDERYVLQIRQANINRYYDCNMSEIGELAHYYSRVGRDNVLMRFERWTDNPQETPLFAALRRASADFGARYIVLDTRSHIFRGNQNNEPQVVGFMAALRRWAMELNAAIILTQHVSARGRSEGTGDYGSVQWQNQARVRLYLHKTKGENPKLVLTTPKSNYGEADGKIELRYERSPGVLVPVSLYDRVREACDN